jgi:RNA polymerase sigma factor (TIGR02999 family)
MLRPMKHRPPTPDPGLDSFVNDGADYGAHYAELVRIARAELARHQRRGTLDTRALVHEAWIRLHAGDPTAFANRRHFYATAAKAMRHVVIDYARARQAERRGAGVEPLPLEFVDLQSVALDSQIDHLVQLDAALDRLAEADPRLVQIVELRFFSGLEVSEVAELLEVSEPTIKRGTRVAKAFLGKELAAGG